MLIMDLKPYLKRKNTDILIVYHKIEMLQRKKELNLRNITNNYLKIQKIRERLILEIPIQLKMTMTQLQVIRKQRLNQVYIHQNIRRCLVNLLKIYQMLVGTVTNK